MSQEKNVSRRNFLKKTAAGALLIAGGTTLGYTVVNGLTAKREMKAKPVSDSNDGTIVELGALQDLSEGPYPIKIQYKTTLKDGWVKNPTEGIVYVTKQDGSDNLVILSSICTHLGCTVPFATEQDKQLTGNAELFFYCPCHQGQYDSLGNQIGGPPPRPLDIFEPIIKEDKVYIHILKPVKRQKPTI